MDSNGVMAKLEFEAKNISETGPNSGPLRKISCHWRDYDINN